MGWFRGDESPSAQAAYGGHPKGGLAEQLEARQAAATAAQQAADGAPDNGGGSGIINPT